MEPLIVVKGAKKIIRDRAVPHLGRFIADAGDFVAVVEESGAGKGVLLNILGLNDQFSSGQLYLFGQEMKQLTGREKCLMKRNTISFLFQDFGSIEYETIDFNLDIGLKFSNLNVSNKRTVELEVLEKININKKLSTPIHTLSGGEKQRVVCAKVLLKNSKIVLANELTGPLDKRDKERVVGILSQQASQGTLIIVVMHDSYLTKIGNKKVVPQEANEKSIFFNKNNKKMSGKSNIKVSNLNIPVAEEEKQNRQHLFQELVTLDTERKINLKDDNKRGSILKYDVLLGIYSTERTLWIVQPHICSGRIEQISKGILDDFHLEYLCLQQSIKGEKQEN